MDPYSHTVLHQQREERLARKMARYEAIGYEGPARLAIRRPVAQLLRAVANRLAPQAAQSAATPAASTPNHIHIRPQG